MSLSEDAVPRLLRGVRVAHDAVRKRDVLMAPERVFVLDPIGKAVLDRVDGRATFGSIVDALAAAYNAPRDRIAEDAGKYISGLIDRRMMEAS
ncbi:MAG: pyrroloquinoline quinone biosynthesis peptide chaperone PqqD [Pseudomonadota bacterium]